MADIRVLHLDMPRAFTTTLKTFDFRAAEVLAQNGVFYDQADLNTDFWQFVIRRSAPTLDLAQFFPPFISPRVASRFAGGIVKSRVLE